MMVGEGVVAVVFVVGVHRQLGGLHLRLAVAEGTAVAVGLVVVQVTPVRLAPALVTWSSTGSRWHRST